MPPPSLLSLSHTISPPPWRVGSYVFGGTDFFDHLATSGGLMGTLSRRLRAGFTLFWGRGYTPMPLPAKCAMVLGDPVPATLPQPPPSSSPPSAAAAASSGGGIPEPTNEQVAELMDRYLDALRRLFDQYKAQAGCPDAVLEIR